MAPDVNPLTNLTVVIRAITAVISRATSLCVRRREHVELRFPASSAGKYEHDLVR